MTNQQSNVKNIALISVFTAIIIILTYTPLGYISIGPVSITTLHIPVILGAILLDKVSLGMAIGTIWGITSLVYAFQSAGVLNPIFYNPLVSVLPRLLVGLVTIIVFKLLSKWTPTHVSMITAAIIGTITNTTLVLSAIYLFGQDVIIKAGIATNTDQVLTFVLSLVTINALFEMLVAAIVVPIIAIPLTRVLNKTA